MKSLAIFPIGPVTLKNGRNHMHGSVFAAWPDGAFMVVRDENGSLRGVSSCGAVESLQRQFPVGALVGLKHDQTLKRIGSLDHTVISHHPMSQTGLTAAAQLHNVGALQMSCLK